MIGPAINDFEDATWGLPSGNALTRVPGGSLSEGE